LSLLFLVSGVATRFMLRKYALAPLLRSRSVRLLIPLVFGMAVIVPPQAYDQIVEASGYPAGFWDFYLRHYWAFGPQFCPRPCILLPTWNHLWFVVYLWVYTMALGAVLMALPGLTGEAERVAAAMRSGPLLLIVPSVLFAAYRIILLPGFPSTHALFGDWYNHALFGTVFLLGFLFAHVKAFWDAIERQRWTALLELYRPAGKPRHRHAAANLWRNRLWLLSVALHGRRARLCQALAQPGFGRAPLSYGCDFSLLHRAPDRDHHDRACAARPRPAAGG
jgi:hypothetical protein